MNKIFLSLILIVGLVFSLNAKTETVDIVTNLSCQSCADKITTAMNGVDGLNSTTVDVATKTVTFQYDNTKLTQKDLATKITNLGFTAGNKTSVNKEACSKKMKDACSTKTAKEIEECKTKKKSCSTKSKKTSNDKKSESDIKS